MTKIQKNRLTLLKNSLKKLRKEDIKFGFITANLDDELNLFYYSIPIIFPDDFKYIGADIIHNKTKLDFYEMCQDFFGINEFTKFLLFYNDSDIDKRTIKFTVEKDNNLKKMEKNIDKILKLK
jgi:hypothetical protein